MATGGILYEIVCSTMIFLIKKRPYCNPWKWRFLYKKLFKDMYDLVVCNYRTRKKNYRGYTFGIINTF